MFSVSYLCLADVVVGFHVALLRIMMKRIRLSRLHLMSGHAQLTKTGQRMLSDIAKLQARHHLFMEALNTDLDFYDEQASSGRLSK